MSAAPEKLLPKPDLAYPREAVEILARLAWNADGCPMGRPSQYLREAELQLRATHHLLITELAACITS